MVYRLYKHVVMPINESELSNYTNEYTAQSGKGD